jgi:ASCH domain
VHLVHFSPDLREGVLTGSITLTYRLWTRPKVKVGGRYRVESGSIEVDDIELVPFASVTSAEVRRCGEVDREQLRARTAHAGPVDDDTLVYRIEFHAVDG